MYLLRRCHVHRMFTGEQTKVGLAWLPAGATAAGERELDKTRKAIRCCDRRRRGTMLRYDTAWSELYIYVCSTEPRVYLTCTLHGGGCALPHHILPGTTVVLYKYCTPSMLRCNFVVVILPPGTRFGSGTVIYRHFCLTYHAASAVHPR